MAELLGEVKTKAQQPVAIPEAEGAEQRVNALKKRAASAERRHLRKREKIDHFTLMPTPESNFLLGFWRQIANPQKASPTWKLLNAISPAGGWAKPYRDHMVSRPLGRAGALAPRLRPACGVGRNAKVHAHPIFIGFFRWPRSGGGKNPNVFGVGEEQVAKMGFCPPFDAFC